MNQSAFDKIDAEAQQARYLKIEGSYKINLDLWNSLEFNAGAYPQIRIFKNVFRKLCDETGQDSSLQLITTEKANILNLHKTGKVYLCYNWRITKKDLAKHKRVILLTVFAAVFVVVIFFIKNKSASQTIDQKIASGELAYKNQILGDLINRDSDGDQVPDWEESLWGTDPNKKDTDGNGVLS